MPESYSVDFSGVSYDGRDRAPGDVHSYRFADGTTTVRAMWTPQSSRDVRLVTDEPLRVTDAMGVTRTLTPRGPVNPLRGRYSLRCGATRPVS